MVRVGLSAQTRDHGSADSRNRCVGVDGAFAHRIINTHAIAKASHRSTALHCFLTAL
jgi:hypothetical protein